MDTLLKNAQSNINLIPQLQNILTNDFPYFSTALLQNNTSAFVFLRNTCRMLVRNNPQNLYFLRQHKQILKNVVFASNEINFKQILAFFENASKFGILDFSFVEMLFNGSERNEMDKIIKVTLAFIKTTDLEVDEIKKYVDLLIPLFENCLDNSTVVEIMIALLQYDIHPYFENNMKILIKKLFDSYSINYKVTILLFLLLIEKYSDCVDIKLVTKFVLDNPKFDVCEEIDKILISFLNDKNETDMNFIFSIIAEYVLKRPVKIDFERNDPLTATAIVLNTVDPLLRIISMNIQLVDFLQNILINKSISDPRMIEVAASLNLKIECVANSEISLFYTIYYFIRSGVKKKINIATLIEFPLCRSILMHYCAELYIVGFEAFDNHLDLIELCLKEPNNKYAMRLLFIIMYLFKNHSKNVIPVLEKYLRTKHGIKSNLVKTEFKNKKANKFMADSLEFYIFDILGLCMKENLVILKSFVLDVIQSFNEELLSYALNLLCFFEDQYDLDLLLNKELWKCCNLEMSIVAFSYLSKTKNIELADFIIDSNLVLKENIHFISFFSRKSIYLEGDQNLIVNLWRGYLDFDYLNCNFIDKRYARTVVSALKKIGRTDFVQKNSGNIIFDILVTVSEFLGV